MDGMKMEMELEMEMESKLIRLYWINEWEKEGKEGEEMDRRKNEKIKTRAGRVRTTKEE